MTRHDPSVPPDTAEPAPADGNATDQNAADQNAADRNRPLPPGLTGPGGRPRVVVVGGGFAGLFAARRLARGPVQVTVLDRTGVHLSSHCSTRSRPGCCPRDRSVPHCGTCSGGTTTSTAWSPRSTTSTSTSAWCTPPARTAATCRSATTT